MHIVKSTVYAVNCIDLRVVNIDLRVVNRWNKLDQQIVGDSTSTPLKMVWTVKKDQDGLLQRLIR